MVSADDGGWVDMLVPSDANASDNWEYVKTRIVQSTGTVGTPAVGDVDGDGVPELFVPLYDEGRLAMYTIGGGLSRRAWRIGERAGRGVTQAWRLVCFVAHLK